MGTRADFYVGLGPDAEWIGSIPWDGYPDGIDPAILAATSEADFRAACNAFLDTEGGTLAHHGWPWPWNDSTGTDYAYCFISSMVCAFNWGESETGDRNPSWPDMSSRKAVTFGPRSGLIVLGGEA